MDDLVLHPETAMDAVTLRVADLESMSSYYSAAFAMEPVAERSRGREVHRVLGRGTTPMVRLVHTPGLPVPGRREAGLFHTAFLFDSPAALAATVYRAASDPRSRFVGSADHLVSEAFYFTDPEGNGIELYADRDRATWPRRGRRVVMSSEPLDPTGYVRTHLDQAVLDAGPSRGGTVGHVHLQVGDLEVARQFYVDTLGFEVTQSDYPGALFVAAGGYHHHVGLNTWNSAGAGPRAASLGLGRLAITVPGRDDLDALADRLTRRGLQFADDGRSVTVDDPWRTEVTVSLPGTDAEELLAR
ncbi:VOC family protein [Isoptericola variabilis]|uniref:Glyoxalase/bleomycin resistance protein/dioxygenase n=1 Tax=Isoptericola variabilis (strain 225) TaxID=743718 RepID=F6FQY1_ISOV2|nr:VOC family protein [Isoptericola variabilis]AEG43866.1 Glyoxalase/bleomycin resistance protein/dioxygenase [Isoptericola variabilis 225]